MSDATLMHTAPVDINASASSYAATRPTIARIQSASRVLKLLEALSFLITKGADTSIPASTIHNMVLAVADTDATDHMCPERSAFISYHPITNISVRM